MRRGAALLLMVAVGVGVSGCGSDGGPGGGATDAQAGTAPVSAVQPASAATVRTALCSDWKEMSRHQQARLVAGMQTFFGGMVDQPGMRGQVLSTSKAFKVIDGYCAPGFADHFRLYRIYGDAAAFTPPR